MKKIITTIFPFMLLMTGLTSCGPKEIKVTSIEFTLEKSEAIIGDQVKIKDIKILPENATDRGVNWTLENPDAGEIHTMGEEPYVIGNIATKTKVVATAIDGSEVSKAVDIEFINPKVTEEEFDKAIHFTGISYAQVQVLVNEVKYFRILSLEFSPKISYQYAQGDEEIYYYKIDDNSYKKLSRYEPDVDWKDIVWDDETGPFPTPETILAGQETATTINIVNMLKTYNCNFSNFSFDEESKTYIAKKVDESNELHEFSLKFENGLVVSFSAKNYNGTSASLKSTYSYKEEEPILPKPIPSFISNI